MSSRGGIQTGSVGKLLSPRSCLVSKEKKKKTKKRWEDEHRKLHVAADVHTTNTVFAQHLLSLEMRDCIFYATLKISLE